MIEVGIMIEAQNGVYWPQWQRLAQAVEELGFVGLWRSDHFTNADPPDKASLELWVSLTWLASHTKRIQFGQLVSPAAFRHPAMMARMAAAVDDLSGGRMNLGLGAGWQVREHSHFGYDLLDVKPRCDRFEEYVEVVARLLRDDDPVTFVGDYYNLQDAVVLPRSQRPGGPPIVIGGNGPKRTLPIAAKFADAWNGVFLTSEKCAALNARLDALIEAEGRKTSDVHRSLMTGVLFGRDDAEVAAKLAPSGRTLAEVCESPLLAGTANAIVEQLGQLAEAGVQRVMLQWMDVDDIDGLAALADGVLGQVA